MNIKDLLKQAKNFNKIAQQAAPPNVPMVGAQPADIQKALENAKLWNASKPIAALLPVAGVPDDASVAINMVVSNKGAVGFSVALNPPNPKVSTKLEGMLRQKVSPVMTKALADAKLPITTTNTLKWLTY
jgi:hypothetical protein